MKIATNVSDKLLVKRKKETSASPAMKTSASQESETSVSDKLL